MGNSQDQRCYAHQTSLFTPVVNSSAAYRVGLYATVQLLQIRYMRPVYGIEVAQEFISTKVGVKTKLTESYLFGLDKVKYTIMVLQDMCRMDILYTD